MVDIRLSLKENPMTKYIVALLALFLGYMPVQAQPGNEQRTRVTDVLALQPAPSGPQLDDAMQAMEQLTASDFTALLSRLVPQGGDNAAIEYAANSYSYHVLLPGKEQQRTVFIAGAVEALATLRDQDNKGFVIQLLQNAGDHTAVEALHSYLTDAYLGEKAARALARIGTDGAGQALMDGLSQADNATAIPMIDALGFMGYAPAEAAVLEKVNGADLVLRTAVLYGLSRFGGPASAEVLLEAAGEAGYAYEPTGAAAAYVNYLYRLVDLGETKTAVRLASKLFKQTRAEEQRPTHIAALGLLTEINGAKQVNTLLKAAQDDDAVYRNAALRLLEPFLTGQTPARLVRLMGRGDEQVQVDLLRYAGDHHLQEALPIARKALQTETPAVRVAAVWAIHQLDSSSELDMLLPLLATGDGVRDAVKDVLLVSDHDQLTQRVMASLEGATDNGVRILLIDVLARRGAGASMPLMRGIIDGNYADSVKRAAYAALPAIVRPEDLDGMLDLLAAVDDRYRRHVQDAVTEAVNRSDDRENRLQEVITRFNGAPADRQQYFFPVFAGVSGPTALVLVSEYADHDNPVLRRAATSALAAWTDAKALPALVGLSRKRVMDTDQSAEVMSGLIRVIGLADLPDDQKVLYLRDAFGAAQTADQRKSILRALQTCGNYQALLFAGKFLDDDELGSTAANTVMNIAMENKQYYGKDVSVLLNKVVRQLSQGGNNSRLDALRKHLAELPEDAGYVSLFNGWDLEGWKGLVADPLKRAAMNPDTLAAEQIKADDMMREDWYAEDGVLHFDGDGYNNIVTAKQYGDIEMLIDWKLDKDGENGDAGIYLRGTPQVQIWDTSRVNVGAQVGSGGLYNNKIHESKPLQAADNPLGEWNTFRITMVGDEVTVYLNGKLVTDHVVLENYWDADLPIFPVEQLELQAHGTHVMYRDIYVRELPRTAAFTLSEEEQGAGFQVLFDGTDMEAWTGNTTAYRISDEGTLAIYPNEGSGGNLYTKETFGDFVYRFEFRLTPGANNGIGIRAPMEGDAAYAGMEIQVLDDGADMYKDLAEYQYHGSVYGVIPAKHGFLRPVGEWNEEEIRVEGNHITVTLNGTVIVDGDIAEASKNGTLDGRAHPGLLRSTGHIGFLGHGSEVHFRNIRVKRL